MYIYDKRLSLEAKGLLSMLILSNIENSSTLSIYTSNNKESINNALDELIKFHYAIFNNEEILEAHPYPYEDKDKPVKVFTTSER